MAQSFCDALVELICEWIVEGNTLQSIADDLNEALYDVENGEYFEIPEEDEEENA